MIMSIYRLALVLHWFLKPNDLCSQKCYQPIKQKSVCNYLCISKLQTQILLNELKTFHQICPIRVIPLGSQLRHYNRQK